MRPAIDKLRAKLDALATVAGPVAGRTAPLYLERKVLFVAKAPSDSLPVASYINRSVQNDSGERLGVVRDVVVRRDGNPALVIIGVGEFLGLSEKQIAVPLDIARAGGQGNDWHVVLYTTRDELREAPAFDATAQGGAAPSAKQ